MEIINFNIWDEPGEDGVQTLNSRPKAGSRREVVEVSRNINDNMLNMELREYSDIRDDSYIMNGVASFNTDAFDAVGDNTCMDRLDSVNLRFDRLRGVTCGYIPFTMHGLHGTLTHYPVRDTVEDSD